ncbi:hypothetical protein AVEN_134606-1 [Araneus ventricosus]|uniref:Sushi domain-containing protein n=1 Tax=Araneus ventricosus TaxID=182803 RepID=A0A4Y2UPE2_ARAVE|nr:hypothetical protein AVEN_134606-1 [Araneus ventricosus]
MCIKLSVCVRSSFQHQFLIAGGDFDENFMPCSSLSRAEFAGMANQQSQLNTLPARDCHRPPHVDNARVTMMYRGAVLTYDCLPGYTLDGGASIYCDGRRWSADPPTCVGKVK